MTKAVVILGAGASAPFGVPVLSRIFQDPWAKRYLENDTWLFEKLNEIVWKPRGCDLDSSHKSLTVEEILTLLRDQEKSGYSHLDHDELIRFRESLYVLIQQAIFVGKSSRGRYLNPLIEKMRTACDHVTWATFNWDCIFESSFWYSTGNDNFTRVNPQVAVDLCDWRGYSTRDLLLKLHGGINWWMINGKLTYLTFSGGGNLINKWKEYEESEDIEDYPVLLEPSYYKYTDTVYEHLERQWAVFFDNMREADAILVVGYTLPAIDTKARSSVSIAFQLNRDANWAVIDPNPTVCENYERLFGSVRFKTFDKDLANFNAALDENLADAFPSVFSS